MNLSLETRPQTLSRQVLGGPPKATGNVGPLHPQLLAVAADAADDDVRVWVFGIVMVDRCPLDAPPEVALDPLH
jgi:hypothetical protein